MAERIKPTLDFARNLYDGLVSFFPKDVFGETVGSRYKVLQSWQGWTNEDFEVYIRGVTTTNSIPEATSKVKAWIKDLSSGKIPPTMPKQDIIEAAKEAEVLKETGNKFEVQRANKGLLLKSQQHAEKIQEQLHAQKLSAEAGAKETLPKTRTGVPETVTPTQAPSKGGENVFISVTRDVNRGFGGIASRVVSSPFRFFYNLGNSTLAGTNPSAASASHLTFNQGIPSSMLKAAIDRKTNLSPDIQGRLVNFYELMKNFESGSPVMSALSKRMFLTQNVGISFDLQKLGLPQAQIFRLSPAGNTLSLARNLFSPKSFLGRVGTQLFGKTFSSFLSGTAAKGATVVAAEGAAAAAGAAAGPPGWTALVLAFAGSKLKDFGSWLSRLIRGEADLSGILSVGLMLGAFLLVPISPLLGAVVFGAGGLLGLGSLAARAGGFGKLAGQGASLGDTALAGLTAVVLPAIGIPAVVALVSVPLIVALIIFIINSGAYLVPPKTSLIAGLVESPYIDVTKTVNGGKDVFENSDLPVSVEYTIEIKAKKGALTNISFDYSCEVIKEGTKPSCPQANIPEAPSVISPTEVFSFTYSHTYDNRFSDSLVIDTISVMADSPDATNAEAAASANVKIGDPPEECPSGWPVAGGYITQGAQTSGSHTGQESIDIGVYSPLVTARHAGIVTVNKSDCLGNYVEIVSTCGGREFFSRYAHLEDVANSIRSGKTVTTGESLGLSGNTGTCTTGAHLHYQFKYTSGASPSYPGNPPYMMTPYIPKSVPRGCGSTQSCATSIP